MQFAQAEQHHPRRNRLRHNRLAIAIEQNTKLRRIQHPIIGVAVLLHQISNKAQLNLGATLRTLGQLTKQTRKIDRRRLSAGNQRIINKQIDNLPQIFA